MELGVRNREEETGAVDKQRGSQSYSVFLWLIALLLHVLWVDQPDPPTTTITTTHPPTHCSPCCFVPAAVGDRAWREGVGEQSLPSGTVGSAWSETAAWGVMCPSASVTRPSAGDDTPSTGGRPVLFRLMETSFTLFGGRVLFLSN